jgi:hypothetical protein
MTDLADCFENFTDSAFRLETLPVYAGVADDPRFAAYVAGEPLPDRSVRTSPWLRNLAVTTAAGKSWSRVHVVDQPLSPYLRYEVLVAYVESAAAGEEIRIADRAANMALAALRRDFWLFDAGTDHATAALMDYAPDGQYIGVEVTTNPSVISSCEAERDLALRHSRELNAYLAATRERQTEAA